MMTSNNAYDPTPLVVAGVNALSNLYTTNVNSELSEKALEENQRQYNETLAEQKTEYAKNMDFLNRQHAEQLDFANRNLQSNEKIAADNLALQMNTFDYNKNFQEKAFDYQKLLNSTQMEREDSSIQRQIADYKAAGLSPLAAIGGNGASSSGASSYNPQGLQAPQYDVSGLNNAAGVYADFAKQYAALSMTARQDYSRSKSQAAHAHNAEILGAKQALLQMKADMHYKNQSMATEMFNSAVNYKDSLLNREYLREQTDYLKDKHNWESKNGYRSENWQAALISAIKEYLNNKGQGDTLIEKAFDVGSNGVEQAKNIVKENFNRIKNPVLDAIDASKESIENAFVATFYAACNAGKVTISSLSNSAKKLYYEGEKVYRKIKGYLD